MLLTCPNCETVFRVDSNAIGASGKAVRCSVCAHVWHANSPMLIPESEPGEFAAALRTVLVPFFVLVLVVGIVSGGITQRSIITAYIPALIPLFTVVGIDVRPEIGQLQIVDMTADYAGDTLRLRGRLYNQAVFYAHAPSLQVTVMSENGEALANATIRPDDAIIRPANATEFFTQLVIENSTEPTVTVVMRDDMPVMAP